MVNHFVGFRFGRPLYRISNPLGDIFISLNGPASSSLCNPYVSASITIRQKGLLCRAISSAPSRSKYNDLKRLNKQRTTVAVQHSPNV